MTRHLRIALALTVPLAGAPALHAQTATPAHTPDSGAAAAPVAAATDDQAAAESSWKKGRPIVIRYSRALDKRGINVFETTKTPGAEFTGFRLDFGAAFTSQIQHLSHQNSALPNVVNGVNTNQLADIGFGFNNSTANLAINAQLTPGIRVALTSYLSSRHHNETWVKDGYIQIDESPFDVAMLNNIFKYTTLRVGHMEINYGDAHFRRTDNGNAMYHPFVGNYILDAFTTEIGGEVYLKAKGVVAMAAITGGEIRGTVLTPEQRGPTYIGKLGVDRTVRKVRMRLTGSMYKADKAMSSTLYSGDRAGSRYYYVLENTAATETAQKDSGMLNPGFKNQVTALQMNPFLKVGGLELFGVVERAEGKTTAEAATRVWTQQAVDVVYRFLPNDALFVGARYNRAEGALTGIAGDVGARRWQFSGGWFITPNIMAKAEYVNQKYVGYPPTNIRRGGKFDGLMLEGVVAF